MYVSQYHVFLCSTQDRDSPYLHYNLYAWLRLQTGFFADEVRKKFLSIKRFHTALQSPVFRACILFDFGLTRVGMTIGPPDR